MVLNFLPFILIVLIYLPMFYLYFNKKSRNTFFEKNTKGIFILFEILSGIIYFLIFVVSLSLTPSIEFFNLFLGLTVYVFGLIITYIGYHQFVKGKKLIEKFPFNISRNPTYFFAFVSILGLIILFKSFILLILLVLQIISTHIIILREEEFLEKRYGRKYLEYKHKTKRYI